VKHTVLKPFKSARQKFKKGDELGPEHDVAPLTHEGLIDGGFIEEVKDDEPAVQAHE